MLNIIRKTGLKSCLTIHVLIVFASAYAYTILAADNNNLIDCSTENNIQIVSEKQISKSINPETKNNMNGVMKDITGNVLSIITPNEAMAATDPISCMEHCSKWILAGGWYCCAEWKPGNPSEDCEIWGCP